MKNSKRIAFWIVWSFQCSISHNLQKTSSSCDDPSRRTLAKKMPSIKRRNYILKTRFFDYEDGSTGKHDAFRKTPLEREMLCTEKMLFHEIDPIELKDVPWLWKIYHGPFQWAFKGNFGTILCQATTNILKGNMFQHVPYAFEVWMEVLLKVSSATWITAFVHNPDR